MEKDYISRRKLVKTLKYITNKKFLITIVDDHDCSFSGMRYRNTCTGRIKSFSVNSYEDGDIKVIINFTNHICMEIWIDSMYFLSHFDLHDRILYSHNNGDGTYSDFEIIIKNNP